MDLATKKTQECSVAALIACFLSAGKTYLYVVSHQEDEEVVEKFLYEEGDKKLTHKRSIKNESDFIQ